MGCHLQGKLRNYTNLIINGIFLALENSFNIGAYQKVNTLIPKYQK